MSVSCFEVVTSRATLFHNLKMLVLVIWNAAHSCAVWVCVGVRITLSLFPSSCTSAKSVA